MFVDTGAWYAAYVASDPQHAIVKPLIDGASTRLITTDFVLVESLNLFRARNEYKRALALGRDLLAHGVAELVQVFQCGFATCLYYVWHVPGQTLEFHVHESCHNATPGNNRCNCFR
jgi:predicted nucleic acid-binding protein